MAYWRLFYHLVWATKNREPLISPDLESVISLSFDLTCDDLGLIVHARGYMPDHVHLSLSIPPKVAIAEAVRRLKGASSHAVNQSVGGSAFAWQDGYGILSFGERNLETVDAYVSNQAEHHARGSVDARLERTDSDR